MSSRDTGAQLVLSLGDDPLGQPTVSHRRVGSGAALKLSRRRLDGHPRAEGQRLRDRLHLGGISGVPQAQRARRTGQPPQPQQVPLPRQLLLARAAPPARLEVVHGLAEAYSSGTLMVKVVRNSAPVFLAASAGVVRVRREPARTSRPVRRHPQRHGSQDLLQVGHRPRRRNSPSERHSPGCSGGRATGAAGAPPLLVRASAAAYAGPDVVHGPFRRPIRDVGSHCDEVLHGRLLLASWQ